MKPVLCISNLRVSFLHVADITSKTSLQAAFTAFGEKFGKIDVCISNAGYLSKLEHIDGADDEDSWKGFETNVKGSSNTIQAFLPHAALNGVLISINAGLATIPAIPKLSSYICSKIASAKIYECLRAEKPELRIINVHPRVAETGMSEKIGVKGEDSPDLVAGFCVWCASEKGRLLKGKFVWANWDVDEFMERKEEIKGSKLLELTTCWARMVLDLPNTYTHLRNDTVGLKWYIDLEPSSNDPERLKVEQYIMYPSIFCSSHHNSLSLFTLVRPEATSHHPLQSPPFPHYPSSRMPSSPDTPNHSTQQ
jgi:hypothetical protein